MNYVQNKDEHGQLAQILLRGGGGVYVLEQHIAADVILCVPTLPVCYVRSRSKTFVVDFIGKEWSQV